MKFLIDRMKEASSHGGFAALAQVGKAFFPEYAATFDAISTICATLAVIIPQVSSVKGA